VADVSPVPHPHYCVHGVQIGWHLAVDPQTVIDHKFCAPCRRCEEGIRPERTTVLPPMTERELRTLRAALNRYIDHHVEAARQPNMDSPLRSDLVTVSRTLRAAVDEALLTIGAPRE
jgi:hypothetical protein